MTKPTQRPWAVEKTQCLQAKDGIHCSINGATGEVVSVAGGLSEADADDIVQACNAHDDLLAACELCGKMISELVEAERPTSTDWMNLRTARYHAHTAVAKAKGTSK